MQERGWAPLRCMQRQPEFGGSGGSMGDRSANPDVVGKRRNRMMRAIVWVVLCLWLLLAGTTKAAEIEGVHFADRHQVNGTTLILNGVGLLRYRIFIKAYVAAFYLGEGVDEWQVLADIPKRLEIEYFWAISGQDFGKAADHLLAKNFSEETLQHLRPRLEKLHALYKDVGPGDRYALTYIPGAGMELALNSHPLGTIEGEDFSAAYFAIWLGDKPLDESLKKQLLYSSTP
jgi:hypothetical protein